MREKKSRECVVFAITNQKGGVAKTTTSLAIADGFFRNGYKTLAIDFDPQSNLSTNMAYLEHKEKGFLDNQIFGALRFISTNPDTPFLLEDALSLVFQTSMGDIIEAGSHLSLFDKEITSADKDTLLKVIVDALRPAYDIIVIDTPPSLGIFTINALSACDKVIIPANPDRFSSDGVKAVYKTIQTIRKAYNPNIQISGILLTRYKDYTVLSRNVRDYLSQKTAPACETIVFDTYIRDSIKFSESQTWFKSFYEIYPREPSTLDYVSFITELYRRRYVV